MTTTKKVYKVAKKLNTTSEVIKELIKKKKINSELKNGIYYVDENEVKNILGSIPNPTKKKRVTIFTVKMKNTQTIIDDLKTLSEYGKKGMKGLGSFDNVVGMAKVGLKNNFTVDDGGVIGEDMIPTLYEEIRNGTNTESSKGSMELDQCISERIRMDWGLWYLLVDPFSQQWTIFILEMLARAEAKPF